MKLKDIIKFLNEKIPQNLALSNDKVGLMDDYDLTQEIDSIKILMDFYPKDDNFGKNTLIITHHPPLFIPKTPTFTIHSNWDIIEGGANEALADSLNLNVIESFDKSTNIGRICEANLTYCELKNKILRKFNEYDIVNKPEKEKLIKKIAIVSGFGLKNPDCGLDVELPFSLLALSVISFLLLSFSYLSISPIKLLFPAPVFPITKMFK